MWRRSWPPPSSAPSPSSWASAPGRTWPPVELTVDGVTISVTGFVDRVDGWVHDGRLYLRVVDYKTGKKSFDLTEVWNGLGLQMLLYLFALEARGPDYYGQPVEGAGGALSPRPGRGGQGEPLHDRRGVAEAAGPGAHPRGWCWTIQRCCPPWRSRGKRATVSCP